MAKMSSCIRFKVQVTLPSLIRKTWYYSDYPVETVKELLARIVKDLQLDCDHNQLVATIDGFPLIPFSEVRTIIRENDTVIITSSSPEIPASPRDDQLLSESVSRAFPSPHESQPYKTGKLPSISSSSSISSLSSSTDHSQNLTVATSTFRGKESIGIKDDQVKYNTEVQKSEGNVYRNGDCPVRIESPYIGSTPRLLPDRRILTESAGDRDPIQLPLSLSKSKRKQVFELMNRRRMHLKFPDSDEESEDKDLPVEGPPCKQPTKEAASKLWVRDVHIGHDGNEVSPNRPENSSSGKRHNGRGKNRRRENRKRRRQGGAAATHTAIETPIVGEGADTSINQQTPPESNQEQQVSGAACEDSNAPDSPGESGQDTSAIVEKMKPLNGIPTENTVIGFKMLQMSEYYTPEVSEYKIAKVVSYDPLSGNISLKNVPGRKEAFGVESKELLDPLIIPDPETGRSTRVPRKFEVPTDELHTASEDAEPEDSEDIESSDPNEPVTLVYKDLMDVKVLELDLLEQQDE